MARRASGVQEEPLWAKVQDWKQIHEKRSEPTRRNARKLTTRQRKLDQQH